MPKSERAAPRPSASVILSRERDSGHEILLGHRVSELPAFPDVWSFPGGAISRVDRAVAESHPEWLLDRDDRVSVFALLREMVEELGVVPDGEGGLTDVDEDIRAEVCADKANWRHLMESGVLTCRGFHCEVITDRTTPPQAPVRFHNLFFHVPTGNPGVTPTFPPGRSEFDEFRWWRPIDLISSWEANEIRLPPPIVTLARDLVEAIENEGDLQSACDALAANPPTGKHRFEYGPGVECILVPTDTLPPVSYTHLTLPTIYSV